MNMLVILALITITIGLAISGQPSQAQDRINPFANPGFTTTNTGAGNVAPVEFVLKAVMPSDNYPLANINGKILEVGDDFFGYELISVSRTGAQLRRDSDIVNLELRPKRDASLQDSKS